MKDIIIAIDGFSGTGKSSTAKQVAISLGYTYIDTGAMYRAVTLAFIRDKIDLSDKEAVAGLLDTITIDFVNDDVHLNGKNVAVEIRNTEVSQLVSNVSAISAVRKRLVLQQQKIGATKGVVMDGRDIGTVVFPNAELKVFMEADIGVRAKRRWMELKEKGIKSSIEEIEKNLAERDKIDSTRADSPLIMAKDAFKIDTSDKTLNQQIEEIVQLAKEKIHDN